MLDGRGILPPCKAKNRRNTGKATALECLLGWLYLRGEKDRINRLFAVMMEEDGDAA